MVRFSETQRQIKEQLDGKYILSPGWINVGDSVVYTTDPFGALTKSCYVGFYPSDPGAVGAWDNSENVSSVLYDNNSTTLKVDPWYTVAGRIAGGDRFVIMSPREGVFWAHGAHMVTRQLFLSGTVWVLTTEYANFVRLIDAIAGVSAPADVPGGVAFLNGANGEWTNKDDVRRGQKKKQKRMANQPRRARPKRQRGTVALSHCAQKYARAIADPFNPVSVGACVPVYPAPPSYKVTAHQRVLTVTVGSGGVGAFRFNPSPFNNFSSAAVTTASFDGTTLEAYAANAKWATVGFSTLPFSTSDAVQARVVSASAKVTYTGTALDLSGMFVSAVDPDHEPLAVLNLTALSTLPYARVENTKRRMNNLSPMFGIKPHETDYTTVRTPLSTYAGTDTVAALNAAPCGFLVSGVPGTTFNVELIIHVEYVGRPAVTGLSKSHTDSRGFEMVQQAGGQLASYLASSAQAAWPTMRRLLVEAGRDVLSSQLGVRLPMIEL